MRAFLLASLLVFCLSCQSGDSPGAQGEPGPDGVQTADAQVADAGTLAGDGVSTDDDGVAQAGDVAQAEDDAIGSAEDGTTAPDTAGADGGAAEDTGTGEDGTPTGDSTGTPDGSSVEEDTSGDTSGPIPGSTAASCGSVEGKDPVDCTAYGDQAAVCVYSDHCWCSEAFSCEFPSQVGPGAECAPGSSCVMTGSYPTTCGAPDQGLEPVDCTLYGDVNAVCVYSNHCMCGEGFVCESTSLSGECEPGSVCIPEGQVPSSCGAPDQELEPVDCTQYGDSEAQCVFSNHCWCSEGFACEEGSSFGDGTECVPGSSCVPAGSVPSSCGSPDQGLEPVNCTAFGDSDAVCVYSNHCLCSEEFQCEQASECRNRRDGITALVCRVARGCLHRLSHQGLLHLERQPVHRDAPCPGGDR